MRVEAESTSSHGAAIVAFEASGLRALSSLFERTKTAVTAFTEVVVREYSGELGKKRGRKGEENEA